MSLLAQAQLFKMSVRRYNILNYNIYDKCCPFQCSVSDFISVYGWTPMMWYAIIRRLNMTVPSMSRPGGVTVYIVRSEDDLSGGAAELSGLLALLRVKTWNIPKISMMANEIQVVGRNCHQMKELPKIMLAGLLF